LSGYRIYDHEVADSTAGCITTLRARNAAQRLHSNLCRLAL